MPERKRQDGKVATALRLELDGEADETCPESQRLLSAVFKLRRRRIGNACRQRSVS